MAVVPTPVTVHASRSVWSARYVSAPQPPPGLIKVAIGFVWGGVGGTSVAGLVAGSRKKSLACPLSMQLVTSRTGIFGKPNFAPGTTATAVPPVPPHSATVGMLTVASTSPTAIATASARPAIVPTTTNSPNPRATRLMKFLRVPFIVFLPSLACSCSPRELDIVAKDGNAAHDLTPIAGRDRLDRVMHRSTVSRCCAARLSLHAQGQHRPDTHNPDRRRHTLRSARKNSVKRA